MLEKLKESLDKITPEEREKYFPKDTTPKGWISIEDYLPKCLAIDFISKGYSEYQVKFEDGREDISWVSDHNVWYYDAKLLGITHWLNK